MVLALAVAVHVSPKSLRLAELEGTKSTLVDLPTLVFSILPAAFLFPATCNYNHPIKATSMTPFFAFNSPFSITQILHQINSNKLLTSYNPYIYAIIFYHVLLCNFHDTDIKIK